MIGSTLAHYRITAALGAGGMGEVWRAEDEKPGRQVALKVLPADVAEDPERLARFEREAKVLASLNHPNIAHFYGLETLASGLGSGMGSGTDAVAETGGDGYSKLTAPAVTTFLVMELVEGEDLSERIAGAPIPVDGNADLGVMALDGSSELRPLRNTKFQERFASLSADGRNLAYESDESGRPEVYIESFPETGVRLQVTRDGGEAPLWASSAELFFWRDDGLHVVAVDTSGALEIGEPELLFAGCRYETNPGRDDDVTADGRRVIFARIPEAAKPREAAVVLNWFSELERLAGQESRR